MNKARRALLALAAALMVATGADAAAVPAEAATPGWRLVFTTHYGAATLASVFDAVIAPGTRDAWAFGKSYDSAGVTPGVPVAAHWDGSAWQQSALPAALTSGVSAASAVSAGNIWAVTQFGDVLHWNGGAWSVAEQLPGASQDSGRMPGVTALSSTDVWVFGGSGTGGLGTWHFDGSTWTQQTGTAGSITSASAVSATNVWAIGSDGSSPQDEIVHYDGTAWQPVVVSPLAGLQFGQILALSATDVWATENPINSGAAVLVHFDGSTWSEVTPPWNLVAILTLAPDLQGGIWLTAEDSVTPRGEVWAAQLTAGGTWSRTLISPDASTTMVALAPIPGTTAVWGAGVSADVPIGAAEPSDAWIWATGTVPVSGPLVAVAALGSGGVPYAQAPQLGAGWHSLGGTVSAPPAVVALPPDPPGDTPTSPVFIAPGTNHQLYIRGVTGSWQPIGPKEASCLSVAATITGSTLTVACEGLNHALYFDTAAVSVSGLPVFTNAWQGLGGTLSAGPAVAPVGGTVTFFVRGTNGVIYTRTLATNFVKAAWTCLGQPAAAAQVATGVTYFACEGTNHALYEASNSGAGWSSTVTLGGTLSAGPAVAPATGSVRFMVVGTTHVVYERTAATGYSSLAGISASGVQVAALN